MDRKIANKIRSTKITKIISIIFAKRLNCLKSPLKNKNLIRTSKKISSAIIIIASKTIDIRAIEAVTGSVNMFIPLWARHIGRVIS